MKTFKYTWAVVIGTAAGMVLIKFGESLIGRAFPLPANLDWHNRAVVADAIRHMPTAAFVSLLVNYIVASFAAGIVATLMGQRVTIIPAIVSGMILTLAGIYNMFAIPQPVWFSAANLCCYLPMVYLGAVVVMKKEK
jgi:large-conductance mechanosensitive channel